jgi:hypothetical protein
LAKKCAISEESVKWLMAAAHVWRCSLQSLAKAGHHHLWYERRNKRKKAVTTTTTREKCGWSEEKKTSEKHWHSISAEALWYDCVRAWSILGIVLHSFPHHDVSPKSYISHIIISLYSVSVSPIVYASYAIIMLHSFSDD